MSGLKNIKLIVLIVGLALAPSLIWHVNANDSSSPVSVAITASPSTICLGQSAHLTWSSINTNNVSIDQGIGSVSATGDRHVSPTQTTIYTITGTNNVSSNTASATVFVSNCNNPTPTPTPTFTPTPTPSHIPTPTPTTLPVSVAITASPSTICDGQSSHLTWSSANATSVSISQGIGHVSANGDRHVSPSRTVIYTITGSNNVSANTASVTVFVNNCATPTPSHMPMPTPSITPTPTPAPATGTIRLVKHVINNNGGTAQPGNFELFVNSVRVQHNVPQTFPVGSYIIAEVQRTDYQLISITGDCLSNGILMLRAGQNAVCTLTNDDIGFTTPTPTPSFSPTPTPSFTPTPTPSFTPTPTPLAVHLSVEPPSCATGSYSVPLVWSGSSGGSGFFVDISTNSNFSTFWNKQVFGNSTSAPSGFNSFSGLGTLALNPGTTYYARVFNGQHSNVVSWNVNLCSTPTPTPTPTPSFTNLTIVKDVRNISSSNNFESNSVGANPSETIEFVIRVTNNSVNFASDVRVSDFLPNQLQYVSNSTTINNNFASDGIVSGNIFLGSLSNGETKIVRFRAQVRDESQFNVGSTQLVNTARAFANNANSVEDTAFVTVNRGQVAGATSLQIQKTGKNITKGDTVERTSINISRGDTIEFIVRVTSPSAGTVSNVFVSDVLPAGLIYLNNTTSLNNTNTVDGIVGGGINIGSLTPGQTAVVRFFARVDTSITTGISLFNVAHVRADNVPQIASNHVVLGTQGVVAGALDVKTGASSTILISTIAGLMAAFGYYFRANALALFGRAV